LRFNSAHHFGRGAVSYHRHADVQRETAHHLIKHLPFLPVPSFILDVGCGTGYAGQRLKALYPENRVFFVDRAYPMAKKAQGIQADAACLPFKDKTFHLIVANMALQWCSDPCVTLSHLVRLGNVVAFSVPTMGTLTTWHRILHDHNLPIAMSFDDVALWEQYISTAHAHIISQETVTIHKTYQGIAGLMYNLKGLGAVATHTPPIPVFAMKQLLRKTESLQDVWCNSIFIIKGAVDG
jgi:malonyl-CoA O-methyltransferase